MCRLPKWRACCSGWVQSYRSCLMPSGSRRSGLHLGRHKPPMYPFLLHNPQIQTMTAFYTHSGAPYGFDNNSGTFWVPFAALCSSHRSLIRYVWQVANSSGGKGVIPHSSQGAAHAPPAASHLHQRQSTASHRTAPHNQEHYISRQLSQVRPLCTLSSSLACLYLGAPGILPPIHAITGLGLLQPNLVGIPTASA